MNCYWAFNPDTDLKPDGTVRHWHPDDKSLADREGIQQVMRGCPSAGQVLKVEDATPEQVQKYEDHFPF